MRIQILSKDATTLLAKGTLRINYKADNADNCSFSLNTKASEYLPFEGQDIKIYDDDNTTVLFGGCIKTVQIESEENGFGDDRYIKVSVTSDGYNHIPSRRTIGTDYTNKTAGYIINHLVTTYLASDGVTVGIIEDGATIAKHKEDPISIKDVLDDMAEASGLVWKIGKDKKMYFVQASTITYCALEIREGNTEFYDFVASKTLDNYRNKQFVQGGLDSTGTQINIIVENTSEITARQTLEGGSGYSSGVYGNVMKNTNITTETDAIAAAEEELRRYKIPASVSFNSHNRGYIAGQMLVVNYPKFGIYSDEYYLIESVSVTKNGKNFDVSVNATRRDIADISTKRSQNDVDFYSKIANKKSATTGGSTAQMLTQLDLYNNGFIATYGTDDVKYTWTKNGSGQITQLTNVDTSEVIPITWNAGDM